MTTDTMFFCIPQQAFMSTANCTTLRDRPNGKVPAGSQPRLRACEKCTMYPLVDKAKVPTVTLAAYLKGKRPNAVNLTSAANRKLLAEPPQRKAG